MTKKIILIFGLAILIRLVLSAITYHSDVQALDVANVVMLQGHIISIYDFFYSLPKDHMFLQHFPVNLFNYPPAIYFYNGLWAWIFSWVVSSRFEQAFIFNYAQTIGDSQLYLHLILLKLPYLLFDLLGALFITKLFVHPSQKVQALILWLFNPVSIYATYMMGQFDIIPTSLSVGSLFLVTKDPQSLKNNLYAALLLGLGASFKIFPLFFLVPLMSNFSNWRKRLAILAAGIAPYVLSITPFLFSKGYRASALVANQTLKSLYAQLPISGGESLIVFLVVLAFVYCLFLMSRLQINLWQKYFVTIIIFFIFTHTHPQWFLWMTPFLILQLIHDKFSSWWLVMLLLFGLVGQIFFFDAGLSLGLFSPLNKDLVDSPTIWQILHRSPDINFSRSLIQSLSVGILLFYFFANMYPLSAFQSNDQKS